MVYNGDVPKPHGMEGKCQMERILNKCIETVNRHLVSQQCQSKEAMIFDHS